MSLLIDGFNLIYKFPDLEEKMYRGKLNEARIGLLEILYSYNKIKKTKIGVVFDGKRDLGDNTRQEQIMGIQVYYSHDFSADHLIKEFIKKDPNPRMTTVVTSDREIIFHLNPFKPEMIKSEDFAELVLQKLEEQNAPPEQPEKEEDPSLSQEEISFWEKMFKKRR
jgi:predicted RNA-binding protein with PIN domain